MLLGGIVILDAVRLGFGWGPDGPQSGFFPFWLALIMVLCCALILLQAVRGNVSKSFVSREQLDSVLKVLWPAVAAVALMHFIGLCRLRALHRFLHALGRASLLGLRRYSCRRHSCRYLPGLREMVSRADAQRSLEAWLG